MSKFIAKLKQVSQGGPPPMGFRAGQSVSAPSKMLIVASLAQVDVDNLADSVAGADAGLISISKLSSGAENLEKASRAVSDIPWGGWLRGTSGKEINQMKKGDCDFVVFPAADTSLTMPKNDEMGRILEVEASLAEGLLRTIDELPVDAVLIAGEQKEGYFLTWQHLMLFWRFANVVAKPLLVSVPSGVTADELQLLWEAGVSGVVMKTGVRGLRKVRQAIDKLTSSGGGRRREVGALLPYISAETEAVDEEE